MGLNSLASRRLKPLGHSRWRALRRALIQVAAGLAAAFLGTCCLEALAAAQTKRAVLIGINTYEPVTPGKKPAASPAKDNPNPQTAREARGPLPNLEGPVNDVRAMQQLLIKRFEFDPANVHVLAQAEATHANILATIKKYLLDEAVPGDISVFFFAGHGSRRLNSLSIEPGNLDSTFVPADSYKGVDDILSKNVVRMFNQILDKKVILTAIFDSCHSGGITRGLPRTGQARFIPFDPRDAKDGGDPGPLPQGRGALILTGAAADELAREGGTRIHHGVFTTALIDALNSLPANSPAELVMRRVNALMTVDGPQDQHAEMLGPGNRSLFGATSKSTGKILLAVTRDNGDGTYELDGGRALRLGVGSEFVRRNATKESPEVRLRLTKVDALSFSTAEIASEDAAAAKKANVKQGDLFNLVKWVVPEQERLRVFIPKALSAAGLAQFASELAKLRQSDAIEWISDPVVRSPSHWLEWGESGFTLRSKLETRKMGGPEEIWKSEDLGQQINAESVFGKLRNGGTEKPKLFAYLPPSAELESELKLGPDTDFSAVERVSLSDAQYTLVGRLGESGAEYAWVQPGTVRDVSIRVAGRDSDGKPTPFCSDSSPLPLRTNWIGLGAGKDSLVKAARDLEQFSSQLGTIAALHKLVPGEAEGEFPYQLGLKRVSDGSIVREGKLIEDEVYDFILTADPAKFSPGLHRQFVYVFVMYCSGEAHLWFPTASNSGEQNHLPLLVPGQDRWPLEIPLNVRPRIVISGPFGQDTYFLVTSEERIRDLNVFEFEPVVTRAGEKDISTSVSSIFRGLGSTTRRSGYTSSSAWSIQRLTFQSVPKDATPGTEPK